ncbi:MAG: aspartate kinase, partial [Candidatus Eremiobacteraeota bacterium]|nr:aspartate kinase [Candidatus Eremiobacteraeota bacterium]
TLIERRHGRKRMTRDREVAVLKFGGTSLATAESREVARQRVMESRQQGYATVVVCSAMGRPPDPYATDTLLNLNPGAQKSNSNTDVLLACGELISAAVFAELLTQQGAKARTLTGAQAGILTNANFGDAKIIRVQPARVQALLEEDVIPVVAGFQGMTMEGDITTLGRGGTDLTAIALGNALEAERVDIYTDVSGAMSADPHRVESARTIERAQLLEMSELSEHGAKVMHSKAAEFARATGTPYAIKGLDTDRGTVVVQSVDHHRPVTGVTSSGNLTFVRIIRGDLEEQRARMQLELQMFERIAEAAISVDQVNINSAGVFFVVSEDDGQSIRRLLADLNMAVRMREHCAKISIVGAGMRGTPGVISGIVQALSGANVEIIHCTDSNITISIVVPDNDVTRAERAVHDYFALDQGESA